MAVRTQLRRWVPALVLAVLALLAALGTGSSSASRTPAPPFGPLRVDVGATDLDDTDPALAYGTLSWQLEYATCAKLVNYPDAPHPEGSRLRPEIAAAMPTISPDRRTYTFQIRNDYAFSPPASGVVTAQSMKYTFERTLHPALQSPAFQFLSNVVGATEYRNGQRNEITGIVAQGSTLTITLIEPQGHFLSLLAMPFLCAVPTSLPPIRVIAPVPSAGPYYISQRTPNSHIVVSRNPNYQGPRPHRFDSIEYTVLLPLEVVRQRVESGISDYTATLPVTAHQELAQLYGPGSPAAARGRQQWFSNAAPCFSYLPMNTERQLFASANMRKAVNFAIDRAAMLALSGFAAGHVTDQYLPPGLPGFVDAQFYPDQPDIARARQLAGWQPGDPPRPGVLYHGNAQPGPQRAQLIRNQLLQIGIDLTLVGWNGFEIYRRMGTRGEPFDIGTAGWCEDYHDPWNFIQLMDGTTIGPENNNNLSYFNDPVFNARMHAAEQLIGDERYAAFQQIEHDLVRDAAPLAAWSNPSEREFFSRRIGCHIHHSVGMTNLAALCLRPEITIDDVTVTEPVFGTTTAVFTVRLSSEMANQVTVNFATEDGTARAGEDYVPTAGTLTFAPNQRTQTLSVIVNADSVVEQGESFFVNLANESSGTLVDGRGIGTIAPPPAPPPPPPRPAPPPPARRCVVPRVVGQRLATARSRIRRANCSVGRVRYARSRKARGRVISQRPRPGTRLARGGRVNVVVSRGRRR